mgnify:FL=1
MIPWQSVSFANIAPEPSADIGMCRLVAQLDGEKVRRIDPHIGFSHRGVEKLAEGKTLLQGLVLADKLNRFAPFSCTHTLALATERLTGAKVPERAIAVRMILAETGRILSHLRATANLAADTGTDVVEPLARRASERIGAMLNVICRGCPAAVFIRAGGIANDVAPQTPEMLFQWLTRELPPVLSEIEDLLTENAVFKSRTVGVGVIDAADALAAGFSGVNLRACGVDWDIRKKEPYEAYAAVPFEVPLKTQGDCYARYLLRLFEIYQSMTIIRHVSEHLPAGEVVNPDFDVGTDGGLTELSRRFELYGNGMRTPAGEVYAATESPSGEFGVFLVSDGGARPYRCRFRSAGFPVMQALNRLTEGGDLADVRVILGSLAVQTTEVDR